MTPKERAAMQQALEALEVSTDWDMSATGKQLQSMKAITALRKALAGDNMSPTEQAEQEPVAWQFFENGKWWIGSEYNHHRQLTEEAGYLIRELYAAPVSIHSESETDSSSSSMRTTVRTKDLTDDVCDEIIKMAEKECGVSTIGWDCLDPRFIVRAVIAADREKNK